MPSRNAQETKKTIKLTKKQFLSLLKIVYLGNWLANAQRTDDRIKEYEEIESFIFSHAKQFGFSEYVDDEFASEGAFYPTGQFEEETKVGLLHEEYDNDSFWEELIDRLARRDVVRKIGEEVLQNLEGIDRVMKLEYAQEKYEKIFSEVGLDAIEVKMNNF